MNLSSQIQGLLAMRNTVHDMGTRPRRAMGSPVIVQVLLCQSMVCLACKEEVMFKGDI